MNKNVMNIVKGAAVGMAAGTKKPPTTIPS